MYLTAYGNLFRKRIYLRKTIDNDNKVQSMGRLGNKIQRTHMKFVFLENEERSVMYNKLY